LVSESENKPSTEQEIAINANGKKICIFACAGSGKTYTLTRRLARLINELHVNPLNVAAITFTNFAANNLKLELSRILTDKYAISQIFVGTIHSFCLKMLKDFLNTELDEYNVLTEGKQYVLLNRFWKQWDIEKIDHKKDKTSLLEQLITTFNIIKMERIDHKKLLVQYPELYHVFSEYNNFLRNNKYWDFSDLILEILNLGETEPIFTKNILNNYKYLFIDEYQDVDPAQHTIINELFEHAEICIVGDDDQSIYQFRGTDVNNILRFSESSDCTTFKLSINRRCPSNILNISKHTISKIKNRKPKAIDTLLPMGQVYLKIFSELNDEIKFITNEIQRLKSNSLVESYSDIAILMRSVSSYGQKYLNSLRAFNIPYICKGGRTLFESPEIVSIVSVLEWIVREPNFILHLYILNSIFSGNLNTDKIKNVEEDISFLSKKQFLDFGLLEQDWDILETLIAIRERYYTNKFGSLLELILEVIACLNIFGKSNHDTVSYNIAQFTQIVNDYEEIAQSKRLQYLCGYIQAYAKKSFDEATPIDNANNVIHILTIHQAKGLEFDYVFIPMLVEKRFPVFAKQKRWLIDNSLFNAERYYDSEDNERRLFYVAVTRAKKGLYLLCSKNVGLIKPKNPSTFFLETSGLKLHDKNKPPNINKKKEKSNKILISSYSSLEYYLTCPYRYKLVIVYGLATPINPFFKFGKIIHAVLSFINRIYRDGNKSTLSIISNFYNNTFDYYYKNANLPYYEIVRQKSRGFKIIENYYNNKTHWLDKVLYVEHSFEYIIENCLIRGRYDLILQLNDGKVQIVDFKTGEMHPYLRTDFQMQIYSLAGIEQLGLPIEQAVIYYVDSEKETNYKVSDEFLFEARTNLLNVVNGIISENYEPKPGGACSRCEVKRFCDFRRTK